MNEINELLLSPNVKKFMSCSSQKKAQTVFGLSEGEIGVLLSLCEGKTILVSSSEQSLTLLSKQLLSLNKECFFLPLVQEQPLYSYAGSESASLAIKALYNFYKSNDGVLLVNAINALQTFPSMETISSSVTKFEVNKTYKLNLISKLLVSIGYDRTQKVSSCGEFSLRGDILDIWLDGNENITRIDFFGEQIESIKEIELSSQTVIKKLDSLLVLPRTTFLVSDEEAPLVLEKLEAAFMAGLRKEKNTTFLAPTIDEIRQGLIDGKRGQNLAFASVFASFKTLFELFPKENIVVCEPKQILEKTNEFYKGFIESLASFISAGTLLPEHKNFFVSPLEAFDFGNNRSRISFQSLLSSSQLFASDQVLKFLINGRQKYIGKRDLLINDIVSFVKTGKKVVLFAGSRGNASFLKSDLEFSKLSNNDKIVVCEQNLPISALFSSENIVFIGTDDMFGAVNTIATKTSKSSAFFLPKVGDFVVHSTHGIGKCVGLERLKFAEFEKDYIVLEYLNGDKLYVPSEQANTISAFRGGESSPKLNKLGGTDFYKSKQKVRASVKAMAIDLLKLYSEREKRKGIVYPKDSWMQKEFEESFEFEETADQLLAVEAIKKDMESDKAMDRLICGDVGFGKTEVAIRAIFKAVSFGKQVAFLCPTTILAEQHYLTCQNRFSPFGLRVKVLSRFRSSKEQKQILQDLKEHKIDILIGTHRLLSKDVVFEDLGLLVLDEEQRFGVAHKEQIKEVKKNVDTIAMSATPIPRTLHMALSGIRDISIIETPPRSRLPILTTVTEYNESILAYSCGKELERGGQVLIVVNRIAKIDVFASKVREILPEAKVAVAHGQMASNELEDTMLKLAHKELDILVATTLIENGIDLPKANTLFVIDAENLGLSQLYQLRGRVGRSDRQAYAYLTFDGRKELSDEAHKRLSAIGEFTELGSGFKIAMRDLEIRGAGEVLGSQQHGHMEKVGYDMYCKILAEVTSELKGEKAEELKEIVMEINADAFLPQNYVSGSEERIAIFSKISICSSSEDEKLLIKGLVEMFGEVPKPLKNLISIARLKNNAQKIGVKKVKISADTSELVFHSGENKHATAILSAVQKHFSTCHLLGGENMVIAFNQKNGSVQEKMDFLIKFCGSCLVS
ncbi:MAG: transcription-repair coupling factor [Clostridia bacterium]